MAEVSRQFLDRVNSFIRQFNTEIKELQNKTAASEVQQRDLIRRVEALEAQIITKVNKL